MRAMDEATSTPMDQPPIPPPSEATLLENLLGADWRQIRRFDADAEDGLDAALAYIEAQRPDLEWDELLRDTVKGALYDAFSMWAADCEPM
jgi:hypothetical protein